MKYILLLLLSTSLAAIISLFASAATNTSEAAAGRKSYAWTQERPPSKSYRWEQIADMKQVTQIKAEAWADQQPDGVCVVYSTMSEYDAKHLWINPRDGRSIWAHEVFMHCNGWTHTIEGTRK